MKLELKHLAGYLPYGIPAKLSQKGIFNQDDEYPNPRTLELGIIKNISFWHPEITGQLHVSDTYSFDFDEIDEVDIVLRPLSDLTKEIEVNGEKFVPYKKLGWEYCNGNTEFGQLIYCEYGESPKTAVNVLEYLDDLEKLYEWHFDIHGLIEKGLAININKN
jgi:hypothetical protein